MTVTLFNRGERTIVGVYPGKFEKSKLDKHGNAMPLKFAFRPETAMAFDEESAARLQRLYPGEVLSVRDAQKQFELTEPSEEKAPEVTEKEKKAVAKKAFGG